MLDHTAGTLTASSAILVDSNSKIDVLNIDNITLNGNTVSTTDSNGDLVLDPQGTGAISLDSATLDASAQATEFKIVDNSATSLVIKEGSTAYMSFVTTNGSENILVGKSMEFDGTTQFDGNVTINEDSADINFRVETNSKVYGFLVAGGDDVIGMGMQPSGTGANVQILGNVSASKFIGEGSQLTGISGGGGGISMSGTTSNGVLTFNTSTQASVESGLTFNGTDLELRAGSGAKVEFLGPAGGQNNGITYMDTGTGQRYGLLFEGSNQVALCNRAASGVVDIRANTSTEGSTGESTKI